MNSIISQLTTAYQQQATESNRSQMIAYMKDHFDYFGIKSPQRKAAFKEIWPQIKVLERVEQWELIHALYDLPQREMHYSALEILDRTKNQLTPDDLPTIERLIRKNSWWDSVDSLAPNMAGTIFMKYPETRLPWVEKWNDDDFMWLKRSAIIHQLRYKKNVDLDLLFALVDDNTGTKEFFINKACGWALREASKVYPAEVRDYVDSRPGLSNLTIREASKYL